MPSTLLRHRFEWFAVYLLLAGTTPMQPVLAATPGKMYWSDSLSDHIRRADLDGTNAQTILSGLNNPGGVALAIAGNKLYWSEQTTPRVLRRSNLDGTNAQTLFAFSFPYNITSMVVDEAGGKVYWGAINGGIHRTNLDGTQDQALTASAFSSPGIALDKTAGKIYWTERENNRIRRANLDGTAAETLITTGVNAPHGIDLDMSSQRIYWTNSALSGGIASIYRAGFNGTGIQSLVTSGLSRPYGIALDPAAGTMYWAESGTGRIQRANLDGSSVQTLITSPLPIDIAVLPVPEPGMVAFICLAGAIVLRRRPPSLRTR